MFHSVFSNVNYVSPALEAELRHARVPIVFFPGNEYKLMPEKIEFARRMGVVLLVSQIARTEVLDLYSQHLGCRAIFVPNAVFDPAPFVDVKPADKRGIDIGYRAFPGVLYLGHDDRTRIAEIVGPLASARGLRLDVSLDPAARLSEPEWHGFLGDCRGQLGTEAGTEYFELDDSTRLAINAYCDRNPKATFRDIEAQFFAVDTPHVSGRTISSRHIEAAAARSVQLLFPGTYGDAFAPNVHYLEVARDGSNIGDVLDQFADRTFCARMADAAYSAAAEYFGEQRLMRVLETEIRGLVA